MDKTTQKWIDSTLSCLKEIHQEFQTNKGLILTEGDLECILYSRLINKPEFSKAIKCETSEWKSGFIHSQVTWFKYKKNSGYEMDITILNPSKLDIKTYKMLKDYPHKDFFYDGEVVGIELKFIRTDKKAVIGKQATEDYHHILKKVLVAKEKNIGKRYFRANMQNTAFISVVVCKTDEVFKTAYESLKRKTNRMSCPKNVLPILFSHSNFKIFTTHV